MNCTFAGSTDATSEFSTGISPMHGAHHVAQNSSTTTFPWRLAQSAFAPSGAWRRWVKASSGAGAPGLGIFGFKIEDWE
jgi:hypothetical protein